MADYNMHILVCGGTGCKASQSELIKANFKKKLNEYGLADEIQVIMTGCFGFCEKGPIVKILPDNTFYTQVAPEDVSEIVDEHIIKGRKVERLLYLNPETQERIGDSKEINFYKKQIRIALRNCGFINPENIEEYIGRNGYSALGTCLSEKTPDEAIRMIKDSGLRGRGGGGFSTGLKWELTRKSISDQKYVVCNADEGDPGAFMDRSVLEADPHAVLEGMIIAAKAINSHHGYIYVRTEYPLAIRLSGKFKTAFPEGRPPVPQKEEKTDKKPKSYRLMLGDNSRVGVF